MKDKDYTFEQCDVICDECDDELRVDSLDYDVINDEMDSYGWIRRRVNGQWYDFCSRECYIKFLDKRGI